MSMLQGDNNSRGLAGGSSGIYQTAVSPQQGPIGSAASGNVLGVPNAGAAVFGNSSDGEYEAAISSLPDDIGQETDEEEEEYKQRCMLYQFDLATNQWKERGVGDVKLMRHKASGRVRVVVRRYQENKVCANHIITPGMELKAAGISDRAWVYNAIDFSEGESSLQKLAIKFQNSEIAQDFKTKFEECETDIAEGRMGGEVTKEPEEDIMAKFQLKEGDWDCDGCCCRNNASVTVCPACQTRKPGSAPAKPASAAQFSFKPTSSSAGGFVQNAPAAEDDFFARFKLKEGGWDCEGCCCRNDASTTVCPACGTCKPNINLNKGKWTCWSCFCVNEATMTACPGCCTPKPVTQTKNNPTGGIEFTFGAPATQPKAKLIDGTEFAFGATTITSKAQPTFTTSKNKNAKNPSTFRSAVKMRAMKTFHKRMIEEITMLKEIQSSHNRILEQNQALMERQNAILESNNALLKQIVKIKKPEKSQPAFSVITPKTGFSFGIKAQPTPGPEFSFGPATKPKAQPTSEPEFSFGPATKPKAQPTSGPEFSFGPATKPKAQPTSGPEFSFGPATKPKAQPTYGTEFSFGASATKPKPTSGTEFSFGPATKPKAQPTSGPEFSFGPATKPKAQPTYGTECSFGASATKPKPTSGTEFSFGPATKPKAQPTSGTEFSFGPATKPKAQPTSGTEFSFGPPTKPKAQPTSGPEFSFGPATKPKAQPTSGTEFSFGPATKPKAQPTSGTEFSFGPATKPKAQPTSGTEFSFGPATTPKAQPTSGTEFSFGPATKPKAQLTSGTAFSFGPFGPTTTKPKSQPTTGSGYPFSKLLIKSKTQPLSEVGFAVVANTKESSTPAVLDLQSSEVSSSSELKKGTDECNMLIAKLFEEGELQTNKESEVILFSSGARVLRFNMGSKAWKDRGSGDVKILSSKETKSFRVIMQHNFENKVCTNHIITTDMKLSNNIRFKSPVVCIWNVEKGEIKRKHLAIKFKYEATAVKFKGVYKECQTKLQSSLNGGGTSTGLEDAEHNPKQDIHFAKLPEKVDLQTGEESEETLFCSRSKLYRFDTESKAWKDRGVGDVKILHNKETGRFRVIMRREQVLKVCANHYITAEMKLTPNAQSKTSWVWQAMDAAEGEPKFEQLAIKFKHEETAVKFKGIFEECQKELQDEDATGSVEKDEDVVFVSEKLPSETLQAKAKSLKLPITFYNYLDAPPCKGCIGCHDEDVDSIDELIWGREDSTATEAAKDPSSTSGCATQPEAQSTPRTGFSFGSQATPSKVQPTSGIGFSFGVPVTLPKAQPAQTAGFSFGLAAMPVKQTAARQDDTTPGGSGPAPSDKPSAPSARTGSTIYSQKPEEDIMAKFQLKESDWDCDGCCCRNNASVTTCPACQTRKPGSAPAKSASATQFSFKPTSSSAGAFAQNVPAADADLLGKLKPKEGAWDCDGCCCRNDAFMTVCPACGTRKPGSGPAPSYNKPSASLGGTITAGGFKPYASMMSSGGFGFGFGTSQQTSTPATETKSAFGFQPLGSGFSFDSPATQPKAQPTSRTGFFFGAPVTPPKAQPAQNVGFSTRCSFNRDNGRNTGLPLFGFGEVKKDTEPTAQNTGFSFGQAATPVKQSALSQEDTTPEGTPTTRVFFDSGDSRNTGLPQFSFGEVTKDTEPTGTSFAFGNMSSIRVSPEQAADQSSQEQTASTQYPFAQALQTIGKNASTSKNVSTPSSSFNDMAKSQVTPTTRFSFDSGDSRNTGLPQFSFGEVKKDTEATAQNTGFSFGQAATPVKQSALIQEDTTPEGTPTTRFSFDSGDCRNTGLPQFSFGEVTKDTEPTGTSFAFGNVSSIHVSPEQAADQSSQEQTASTQYPFAQALQTIGKNASTSKNVSTPSSSFNDMAKSQVTPTTRFSFDSGDSRNTGLPQFSFGEVKKDTEATAQNTGFSFGQAATPVKQSALSQEDTTPEGTPTTRFSFDSGDSRNTGLPQFSFGEVKKDTEPTAQNKDFSFGQAATPVKQSALSQEDTTPEGTPTTRFSFDSGDSRNTGLPQFSFGEVKKDTEATAQNTGFSFGQAATPVKQSALSQEDTTPEGTPTTRFSFDSGDSRNTGLPQFSFGEVTKDTEPTGTSFAFGNMSSIRASPEQAADQSSQEQTASTQYPFAQALQTIGKNASTSKNVSTSSSSFNDMAKSQEGPVFSFRMDVTSISTKQLPSKLFKSSDRVYYTNEEGDDIYFGPIVQHPVNVLKTGEEDEYAVFTHRCKLYRYHGKTKQWKERGLGDIKILYNNTSGRYRIVMRRDQVLKVCANHFLTETMKLSPNAGSDRSWVWQAMDAADGKAQVEQLAVKFRMPETAAKFKDIFEAAVETLQKKDTISRGSLSSGPVTTESKSDVTEESSTPEVSDVQSSEVSSNSDLKKKTEVRNIETALREIFKDSPKPPTASSVTSTVSGDAEHNRTETEAERDIHFDSIAKLPEKVDLQTGEESEETLFCSRSKLYRFDMESKAWKDRGVGDVKILRNKETGRYRVIMRREQVLKVCVNHYITAEMKLTTNAQSKTSWVWQAMDAAEGEPKFEQLAIKFKHEETAVEFKGVFEECQKKLQNCNGDATGGVEDEIEKGERTSYTQATPNSVGSDNTSSPSTSKGSTIGDGPVESSSDDPGVVTSTLSAASPDLIPKSKSSRELHIGPSSTKGGFMSLLKDSLYGMPGARDEGESSSETTTGTTSSDSYNMSDNEDGKDIDGVAW